MVFPTLPGILLIVIPALLSNWIGGRMTLWTSPFFRRNSIPDLTGKVAIVTGANTGIGFSSARELARKGAKVIVASRSEERGKDAVARIKKQLKGLKGADLVEFMKLDLGSFSQIRSFARSFLWSNRQLDILILNAGIMVPPFEKTKDGFESQIGVNHLGHFLLTKLLTPVLKQSKARVVSVSSLAHIGPYPGGIKFDTFRDGTGYNAVAAYGQSKLANILFCNEFARKMAGTGVTCNSLHPGSIKTELSRHIESGVKGRVAKGLLAILDLMLTPIFLNADDGALTQLYVATSPKLEGVTGEYFIPTASKGRASALARNETLAKLLWVESERLTR